ncbi:MAG: prepilin-type N-terminal cleavage/methylation domain-containing protein [Elusimicrobiaceae bacterium]|nr:prepilin-type N-terminal cleavage/methylation domain-containing protein [Elusimicrobiaceae bacterium]
MKKKAFTLTELLVAVVIIGVLSAIVLPKFTKVLETRKTGEAEEMMAAVRTEQEARCMLDKPYFTDKNQLASKPKNEGSNFSYTLTNGGITATSLSGNYELRIPSYADGRICCSGSGCDKLDKDYPKCTDLQAKSDYTPANEECVPQGVTPPPPPCTLQEYSEECPEGSEGQIIWKVGSDCKYYQESTCAPKKGCKEGAIKFPVTGKSLHDKGELVEGEPVLAEPCQKCINGKWEDIVCPSSKPYSPSGGSASSEDQELVTCFIGGALATNAPNDVTDFTDPGPSYVGNFSNFCTAYTPGKHTAYHTDWKCGGQANNGHYVTNNLTSGSCEVGKSYVYTPSGKVASCNSATGKVTYSWKCVTCAQVPKDRCLTKL